MGIDIWEVIDAAATKPFGFMPFYPGPGLGGHCIPIDPFYLTWKAREFGIATRFIELAGEINTAMPRYVVDRLARGAGPASWARPQRQSASCCSGMAYKKNVSDMRESPSLVLIEAARSAAASLIITIPTSPKSRRRANMPPGGERSVPLGEMSRVTTRC